MESFDAPAVFNDDFRYFYADRIGRERTDRELARIRELGGFAPGQLALDLCCGTGRITRGLEVEGLRVIGLDLSWDLLEAARSGPPGIAGFRGVHGDMRDLPFGPVFDHLICWYSSFGYFDDDTNRAVLDEMRRVLRPGGRLLLDLDGKAKLLQSGLPTTVFERGSDVMVEQFRFDEDTSRVEVERIVVRADAVRQSSYFVRTFTEPEVRSWLAAAGFAAVRVLGAEGEEFLPSDRRMVVEARRA